MDNIKNFKNYLIETRGLSENSVLSYIYDIRKFNDFLFSRDKTLVSFGYNNVKDFLELRMANGDSMKTVVRSLISINNFFMFAVDTKIAGSIEYNGEMERPKIERKDPDVLDQDEIKKIFNKISSDDIYGLRDKALLDVLYSCGLKISEVINLKSEDVDLIDFKIIIHGYKGRRIEISDSTFKILDKYLNESRSFILNSRESEYFFVSKKGSKLNRRSVWRVLKRYVDKSGIEKNISLNTLRHSRTSHLMQEGKSPWEIRKMLGYVDKSSAQQYFRTIRDQQEVDLDEQG